MNPFSLVWMAVTMMRGRVNKPPVVSLEKPIQKPIFVHILPHL